MKRKDASSIPAIELSEAVTPPLWALWERRLLDAMSNAAHAYVERYARPDGTLVWRDDWPGMDGSDDAYESFCTLPLLYVLGGSETVLALARREWEAITWQWTEYGQVYREFDAYYDWMHHGESSLYLYFLGLADPYAYRDRQRAVNFARMYTGEDSEAPNYDPEHRLIRSPLNGSRGPRLEISREDWSTHRDVLRHYPAPFEDVPGVPPGARAEWNDDATFTAILDLMNRRMARGDVPLNLIATSMAAHAFLFTGEGRFRDWVLDYLAAWEERTRRNGGITPDNVGLTGEIGEFMDGKWWGGYYGWRWPHGAPVLLEALAIGGMNAVLLTGDARCLELARSQMDALWALGREEGGRRHLPHRHLDAGWTDFRVMTSDLPIHLWSLSETGDDLARAGRFADQEERRVSPAVTANGWRCVPDWFAYVRGRYPDYPEKALSATHEEMHRRLEAMRGDTADPKSVYIQHWYAMNPVVCDAMAQLMLGAPVPIYHGGLLHCRAFYFDPERDRPGLPSDVAALVESVVPGGFRLHLVNLHPQEERRVMVQAGAFAEHAFAGVRVAGSSEETALQSHWLDVALRPGCGAALDLRVSRHTQAPRYAFPWRPPPGSADLIRHRTPDVDPGALLFFPDWE